MIRPDSAAQPGAAKETRDINRLVHGVLLIGLLVAAALMIAGGLLAIAHHQHLALAVTPLAALPAGLHRLDGSAVACLGLLVLIATPVLRVAGSVLAFLYERDYRFAVITSVVLAVLAASVLLGRG